MSNRDEFPRETKLAVALRASHLCSFPGLCRTHAGMIDRNEVTYTADILRAMKRDHEAYCATRQQNAALAGESIPDLIASRPTDGLCTIGQA
jgi:hypothetical protein